MLEALLGAGKLTAMGIFLAIGFWGARKITDNIDVFIATHSKSYKELVETIAREQGATNGSGTTKNCFEGPSPT